MGIASPSCRQFLSKWFGQLGDLLGLVVAAVVLTPLFFLGFTSARCVSWLNGRDPLQLRHDNSRTYWLPMDDGQRKVRHIHSMFVTEPRLTRRGWSWISLVAAAAGVLVVGELFLRALGFGNAVLYQHSELAGYYPAPHQDVTRLGGRVVTNQFGMRAPDFDPQKPVGVFRILMIGDSTLYGGQYVDQTELYPRLLQQRLTEQAKGRAVEVLNIGVNGWGPLNELGYIREFGAFASDVAVLCLPTDDFRRPLVHMWDTPYFRATAPPRCAYEEVLYHLNWRQRNRNVKPTVDEREQQIEVGLATYIELATLLKQQGCEVLVEVLPSRTAATTPTVPEKESRLLERFALSLKKAGFDEPHFPAGFLIGRDNADKLYHDSIHLDVAGHAAYADYLVPQVIAARAWQAWQSTSRVGE
jgi:hypothetical protein